MVMIEEGFAKVFRRALTINETRSGIFFWEVARQALRRIFFKRD